MLGEEHSIPLAVAGAHEELSCICNPSLSVTHPALPCPAQPTRLAQELAATCDADPACKAFVYLPNGVDSLSEVGAQAGGQLRCICSPSGCLAPDGL